MSEGIMQANQSNSQQMLTAGGTKRTTSFTPLDGLNQTSLPSENKQSANSAKEHDQKRTKVKHNGTNKARQVRKRNADETVLDAVEILLQRIWRSSHEGASISEPPKEFGWVAGDMQSEAAFCRAPPVPAKLAGDDVSKCEFEAYIHELTERGHGIATLEDLEDLNKLVSGGGRPWIFVVPFVLKGEKVKIRTVRHEWGYTQSDLLTVLDAAPSRIEAPCQYFGKCSGCQLQHIRYQDQLVFKREMVERAFINANPIFAKLNIATVSQSPLPYGYRTKLTPHFDIQKSIPPEQVAIGFNIVGQRRVLDIEDCIIGTDAVRQGAVKVRQETKAKMVEYKRGATLLVRETNVSPNDPNGDVVGVPAAELVKDFILDPKSWVTDVVEDKKFRFPASSFFQNNASILPSFTGYVRDELQKWGRQIAALRGSGELKYLIDAYCGSGLFGIACHSGFEKVMGIEISNESISCANNNARMNGVNNCDFILGDATKIFEKVETSADHTAVIIDPPRKGSSPEFLDQLVAYGPRVIVYIACGVPAQAQDINYMFSQGALVIDGQKASDTTSVPASVYRIVSIQPFDLFPQTYHVENIVILVRED
ncbi:tRNA(m5U54)methyltransferase [Coemansia spiralis]|uniref:tRNA(M5U54)methyltransferase n=2 Tax=Coemansia TaxID=4863 RepID=A0A9W8KX70_9FUNG|nr:tRNA(m5U54)methyltransferase [Coemansia umbellata]KAJ2624327.1 tRNA(m5U54)methyltransferase [Coemansia sp. RSA 1358]KAJ2675926.1 tRNA(m5U54)methyltransferase [Coemansia spiralis]